MLGIKKKIKDQNFIQVTIIIIRICDISLYKKLKQGYYYDNYEINLFKLSAQIYIANNFICHYI